MVINSILDTVGNTPLLQLSVKDLDHLDVKVKLESFNPTGSVKDRAASHILKHLLKSGKINQRTTIIESSSGNFGVALSAFCKSLKLRFVCVVDPYISVLNESLMRSFGAEIVKVTNADSKGGYLLSRIAEVKRLCSVIENSCWINQYENIENSNGYKSLGYEICQAVDKLDYLFLGVGSGGTVAGVSKVVKNKFPHSKIIAVDAVGSVIFGAEPKKRSIPGIGSSMVPKILKEALIDEVIWIDETETIHKCHELLTHNFLMMGGSSGSVYAAIKKYFLNHRLALPAKVVAIFPDTGSKYLTTIYNEKWVKAYLQKKQENSLSTFSI